MRRLFTFIGIAVVAGAVILCVAVVGLTALGRSQRPTTSNSAPAETSSSGPARVGERVVAGRTALTVIKIDRTAQAGDFLKAKAGNEYIIAEVLIEAQADSTPYNPLYFKVKDADGVEYSAALGSGDKSLKSGDLTKGDKARGTIAFEVPKGAKGLVLSYKPLVILGDDKEIRVALE